LENKIVLLNKEVEDHKLANNSVRKSSALIEELEQKITELNSEKLQLQQGA
jgi:hypothetical protein